MEEDGSLGYGRSLHVPSVQEIVRNNYHSVPDRYIRETKDRPVTESPTSDSLPVINMSLLAEGDKDELGKLDFACREWGFFQVRLVDI